MLFTEDVWNLKGSVEDDGCFVRPTTLVQDAGQADQSYVLELPVGMAN